MLDGGKRYGCQRLIGPKSASLGGNGFLDPGWACNFNFSKGTTVGRSQIDPIFQVRQVRFGELLAVVGHVRLLLVSRQLINEAVAGFPGQNGRAAIAPFEEPVAIAEIETAFGRLAPMAAQTMAGENALNLFLEQFEAAGHLVGMSRIEGLPGLCLAAGRRASGCSKR